MPTPRVDDLLAVLHDRAGGQAVVTVALGTEPESEILTAQGELHHFFVANPHALPIADDFADEVAGRFELADERGERVASFHIEPGAVRRIDHYPQDDGGDRYVLWHFNGVSLTIAFPPRG
jgi:hypothetical protein